MHDHVCRFCRQLFKTADLEKHVCPDCLENVKKELICDQKLRFQVIESILQDEIAIERLAKAVFSVPVKNIGIGGNGSIAEFFRPES